VLHPTIELPFISKLVSTITNQKQFDSQSHTPNNIIYESFLDEKKRAEGGVDDNKSLILFHIAAFWFI
jgi:hypothetical protein